MSTAPVFDSFRGLMELEPHGPDVFVGCSPEYPWGRVYGGQVVAQGLKAAIATVDDGFSPHSLHAYFLRGGTWDEPIRYEVDRIRNGRSFVTRLVVARQSNGAILNLSCSFQRAEDEPDIQTARLPEGLPAPDALEPDDWGFLQRRPVPAEYTGSSTMALWVRLATDLGPDRHADLVGLAFTSDDLPTEAVLADHPAVDVGEPWPEGAMSASLDHAVWFHRPAPAGEWQLHLLDGHGLVGARGLSFGRVFTIDGVHVASLAQEILFRSPRR